MYIQNSNLKTMPEDSNLTVFIGVALTKTKRNMGPNS